ncbi:MAG: M20/M25/M40 family metallo-hydrolase [Anaerolineae bacterium]
MDPVELTKTLVRMPSVSSQSNAAIADYVETLLREDGFETERLEYTDANGALKVSIVGRKGNGAGGFMMASHFDTVPGAGWTTRNPFEPVIEGGRMIGLGACDMKGPFAATVAAAAAYRGSDLKHPVYIVVTSDEEISGEGASRVTFHSRLLSDNRPECGVIAEPTELVPVYAHKGIAKVNVTAIGQAAHTSTDRGVSANFLIAPFLADMAQLATRFRADTSFQNPSFDPPTNGFNLVLNDGGCAVNVTAARTTATLGYRPMPDARSEEVAEMVGERARYYGLEVTSTAYLPPFYTPPDAPIVRAAIEASGVESAVTVPYGTDGLYLQNVAPLVVLGPGNILQAHTDGEWIEIAQITRAVEVYRRMIETFCL